MKTIKTRRLTVRRHDGRLQKVDAKPAAEGALFGTPTVGGVELSADREKQSFDQALRDTIELNRKTLIRLAKH